MFVFRDGCHFLRSKPDLLAALFALTSDPSIAVAKDCYHILINLSADETLHQVISPVWMSSLTAVILDISQPPETRLVHSLCLVQVLVADVNVLPVLFKNLVDPEYQLSDQICTILSNLSRHQKTCKTVFKVSYVQSFTRDTLVWLHLVLYQWPADSNKDSLIIRSSPPLKKCVFVVF